MVKELCADYATYSPIFETPAKGEPKGVEGLKKAMQEVDIKIFALGGIITQQHVAQLETAKPYGFASIRYFYEDL
jgi:thiamine-phosphate pyrophosphorylase